MLSTAAAGAESGDTIVSTTETHSIPEPTKADSPNVPATEDVKLSKLPATRPRPAPYGYTGPPQSPSVNEVEGNLQDEAVWRRFQAAHVSAQTLSAQRREWYARSVRLYVLWWFWLTVVGAVVGLILLAVLVAATNGDPSSYDPYGMSGP